MQFAYLFAKFHFVDIQGKVSILLILSFDKFPG